MSDLGVLQTPYGVFDSRLPRCDAQASPAPTAARNDGYSWIASCVSKVIGRKLWACWTAGVKQLFISQPAS
jgi:hypothetical protein